MPESIEKLIIVINKTNMAVVSDGGALLSDLYQSVMFEIAHVKASKYNFNYQVSVL